MFSNVRIVLVETYHPGNIGAAARAMKTMGLKDLYLVSPKSFPSSESTNRAAGAKDILDKAVIVDNLDLAIADRTQIFATTARQKQSFAGHQVNVTQAAEWIHRNSSEKIAILFGPERTGLSADLLQLCQQVLYIPGNPEYDVLNMASAVQIVCYEILRQSNGNTRSSEPKVSQTSNERLLANQKEQDHFYQHLEGALTQTGYINSAQPTDTMKKLRQFLNRAKPTKSDISMLRGMVKSLASGKQLR